MLAIPSGHGDLGEDMSKKARRGKTETLALPMAGKVAVVAIAVAALGYGLLSRPASVQPVRKPSARQAPLPPPLPARTSAPASAPASLRLRLRLRLRLPLQRLRSKFRKPLTLPENLFGRSLITSATRRQAPSSSTPETPFFISC